MPCMVIKTRSLMIILIGQTTKSQSYKCRSQTKNSVTNTSLDKIFTMLHKKGMFSEVLFTCKLFHNLSLRILGCVTSHALLLAKRQQKIFSKSRSIYCIDANSHLSNIASSLILSDIYNYKHLKLTYPSNLTFTPYPNLSK